MTDRLAGPTRIESRGSVWLLDDDLGQYMRFPKEEKPRENGWGASDQGPLADAVWHPMVSWRVEPQGVKYHGAPALVIVCSDEPGDAVIAPLPLDVYDRLKEAI